MTRRVHDGLMEDPLRDAELLVGQFERRALQPIGQLDEFLADAGVIDGLSGGHAERQVELRDGRGTKPYRPTCRRPLPISPMKV